MGRTSPHTGYRHRERERSRERERRRREREDRKDRRRPRSPETSRRYRSRSRSPKGSSTDKPVGGAVPSFLLKRPEISDKDLEGKSEEEQEMLKLMGFSGFDSTKVSIGPFLFGDCIFLGHVI